MPWTPARLRQAGWPVWLGVNALAVASYFGFGAIVNAFFSAYGLFPAPIWLPTSAALIAAMIGGWRVLPGIFLGSFLTNEILFAPPLAITTTISITNALGPVLGAVVLMHLRPRSGLFTSFSGIIAFIVCTTFLSPAVSATGGAIAMSLGQAFDPSSFYSTWVNWWLTDSGGTLYLAPAVVLWLGLEHEPELGAGMHRSGFQRRDLAVWAWIALICLVLFLTPPLHGSYIRSAFPFLLVVPLSWIALRMSLRSAYTLVSLVAIVATAGTVAGYGPFQNHALANPLQLVGTLVVLLATNILTIVALVSERQEAERSNRAKSLFLAHTSHELRTPLNAIIGFSSLINSQAIGPISEPRYADYARLIYSSSEHLLALINGLLKMTKIETGHIKLDEEHVALAALIEPAVALIRVQAEAKSIALRIDLPENEVVLNLDPRAWHQILLNLLSNSVKFTPTKGVAGIVADVLPNGDLRLRVWDSGIGIPPDALERVFTPFERAHTRTKPQIEGTGLGLSIARGLVMLHGGTISLDSMVEGGTTVTVTIPARRIVSARSGLPLAKAS